MPAVRVRLVIGEVRLAFEGDEALFARTIAPLVEAAYRRHFGPGAAPAPTPPAETSAEADAGDLSDAEPGERTPDASFVPQSGKFSSFVRQVGSRAGTPEQQVVAFAFYLWNYEDRRRFGVAELEGCFRAVGLAAPEPLEPCISDLCDQKRFLAKHNAHGQLELTPKGVNYVKTRLLSAL